MNVRLSDYDIVQTLMGMIRQLGSSPPTAVDETLAAFQPELSQLEAQIARLKSRPGQPSYRLEPVTEQQRIMDMSG